MILRKTLALLTAVLCAFLCLPAHAQQDTLVAYYDAYNGGAPFRAWTIEQQYAFASELPALIEEYSQKPGFYIPPSLEEVLSHSYGLPAEEDLTQGQAQEAAITFLLALGQETEEELRAATWNFSFLTDDPDAPLWLINVYNGVSTARNRLYRLSILSRSGEITLEYDHLASPEQTPEEILMVFKRQFPDESFDQTYQEKAMIGDKILELMALYPDFNADKSYTICGLPKENEVSYEEGLAFAKEVLARDYGGDGTWSEEAYPLWYAEFILSSPAVPEEAIPVWNFVLRNPQSGEFFQIYVHAGPDGPKLVEVYVSWNSNG